MRHAIAAALLLILGVGCAGQHMSDDFGVRTRAALAKQAAKGQTDNIAELDAVDARNALDAHHNAGTQQQQVVPPIVPVLP